MLASERTRLGRYQPWCDRSQRTADIMEERIVKMIRVREWGRERDGHAL